MANTSAVYARIDTKLKENAEGILSQFGISPSSAIQMLYSQIVLKKGIPFELEAPDTVERQVKRIRKEIRSLDFMPMHFLSACHVHL